eukprot:COSAG01_NODE_639_length_14598_cov_316.689841_13_plen_109_part_00
MTIRPGPAVTVLPLGLSSHLVALIAIAAVMRSSSSSSSSSELLLPRCPAGFKANPSGPGYWNVPKPDPPVCNASGTPPLPCHTESTMPKCAARCRSISDCVAFEVGGG